MRNQSRSEHHEYDISWWGSDNGAFTLSSLRVQLCVTMWLKQDSNAAKFRVHFPLRMERVGQEKVAFSTGTMLI